MLEVIYRYKKSFDFTIKNNDGKTPLEIGNPNCFCQSPLFDKLINTKKAVKDENITNNVKSVNSDSKTLKIPEGNLK